MNTPHRKIVSVCCSYYWLTWLTCFCEFGYFSTDVIRGLSHRSVHSERVYVCDFLSFIIIQFINSLTYKYYIPIYNFWHKQWATTYSNSATTIFFQVWRRLCPGERLHWIHELEHLYANYSTHKKYSSAHNFFPTWGSLF